METSGSGVASAFGAGPSKSTGSTEPDKRSGDGSVDDFEDSTSQKKRKRGPNARGIMLESSVRLPKRASFGGGPSKSTCSNEPDKRSCDGSVDDFEDSTSQKNQKRGPNARGILLDEYTLIDIVKYNGRLIPPVVKRLVGKYRQNPKPIVVEILTMLFEACGAKHLLDPTSLDEMTVEDVVLSLVDLARNGEIEDNFNSKKKELRNFKKNLASFWDELVLQCQDGPLFDNLLFEKCIPFVIDLSDTSSRIYRQVASLVGLQLVTSFITVAKTLGGQQETAQRKINAEKKKKSKGPRAKLLNGRLIETKERISAIKKMMTRISEGLFKQGYLDSDPDIRMACIESLGIWIVSYPSCFLNDFYLEYLRWTLLDKCAAVRRTSVLALQNLYEVDENVPLVGLFTGSFRSWMIKLADENFCNRVIERAEDIDISVAVSAIGLLRQLLRHRLISNDQLKSLHYLFFDKEPKIRRAYGELVYDHLIALNVRSSQAGPKGGDDESSKAHLGRLLQILNKYSDNPISIAYVIDDVWDDMKAMKDWNCIINMLLDESPLIELTDVDATNLVRLLCASARKAVGERIVHVTDNRKPHLTEAQKEAIENSRRKVTTVMMQSYPQLLHKYLADKAKVSSLVEIILLLKLELFSLKKQEQNFKSVLELVINAFFRHGEKDTLVACLTALSFCSTESHAELQDYAQNKHKDLEMELMVKLILAMRDDVVGDVEFSLLVNLKRLYELQLEKFSSNDGLFEDMASIVRNIKDFEVVEFLLLNMFLHVAWCLQSIDRENPSEPLVTSLLSTRSTLFQNLEHFADLLSKVQKKGRSESLLSYKVCCMLSEAWCLFNKSIYESTRLERLGYYPDTLILQKFWNLCEEQICIIDEAVDGEENNEYINRRKKVIVAAARLISSNTVPKDYLGPEVISHFVMHGDGVAEVIKELIAVLKKWASDKIPTLFLEAMKRAYGRHLVGLSGLHGESLASKSFSDCKKLARRLSATFVGAALNTHKSDILKIVKDAISFAFVDAPKQLSFLEGAVLPFALKLPMPDTLDILADVEKRSANVNIDEDRSGWRPYRTFIKHLRERNVQGMHRCQE